jgi:hypothetical protein
VNRDSSSIEERCGAADSVEWKLLLAASVGDAGEGDLAQVRAVLEARERENPVDWDRVLRLAEDHGTNLLLHKNLSRLSDVVPAAVLESLRRGYEENILKTLFVARELVRVLDCLEAAGIEAIPYKGVVLAEMYYGDMALRRAGDMDLFIRRKDAKRAKKVVCELGFTARVNIPEDAEDDYIASGYESTFDGAAGKNLLELQWALQPRFYAVDFDMEKLFAQAVKVEVAGREMRTAGAEDLLLVLAVHAAKHVWDRLIWLCDIAQILKREKLDWARVQKRAREVGIERILHVSLLLTHRFWGTEIPVEIAPAARGFVEEIAGSMAAGVTYEEQKVAYFRLMMRLRERRGDRVRFLARLTFTPGPGEWETVRLPRSLFPFYRVVRMVRLAGRLAGG